MTSLFFENGHGVVRNLRGVPTLYHQAGEGLDEEAAVLATQQSLGKVAPRLPSNAHVYLLVHLASAPLALAVYLVEEVIALLLGSKLIPVALNELQMNFRVKLLEDAHS